MLVKALARVWRWQKLLDNGVYSSLTGISEAEKINRSYVSRILRLTRLAAVIVEAILGGSAGDAEETGAVAAGGVRGAAAEPVFRRIGRSDGRGRLTRSSPNPLPEDEQGSVRQARHGAAVKEPPGRREVGQPRP
jgi:hypothetical protein